MDNKLSSYLESLKSLQNNQPLIDIDALQSSLIENPGGLMNNIKKLITKGWIKMFGIGVTTIGLFVSGMMLFTSPDHKEGVKVPGNTIAANKTIDLLSATPLSNNGFIVEEEHLTTTKPAANVGKKEVTAKKDLQLISDKTEEIQKDLARDIPATQDIARNVPKIENDTEVPVTTNLMETELQQDMADITNEQQDNLPVNNPDNEKPEIFNPEYRHSVTLNFFHTFLGLWEIQYEYNSSKKITFGGKFAIGSAEGLYSEYKTTTGINEKYPLTFYALGAKVDYYLFGDFELGAKVGLDATFYKSGYAAIDISSFYGSGKGIILSPFVGGKLILAPGFTADLQFGVGLMYYSYFREFSFTTDYNKQNIIHDGRLTELYYSALLLHVNFGWSF